MTWTNKAYTQGNYILENYNQAWPMRGGTAKNHPVVEKNGKTSSCPIPHIVEYLAAWGVVNKLNF